MVSSTRAPSTGQNIDVHVWSTNGYEIKNKDKHRIQLKIKKQITKVTSFADLGKVAFGQRGSDTILILFHVLLVAVASIFLLTLGTQLVVLLTLTPMCNRAMTGLLPNEIKKPNAVAEKWLDDSAARAWVKVVGENNIPMVIENEADKIDYKHAAYTGIASEHWYCAPEVPPLGMTVSEYRTTKEADIGRLKKEKETERYWSLLTEIVSTYQRKDEEGNELPSEREKLKEQLKEVLEKADGDCQTAILNGLETNAKKAIDEKSITKGTIMYNIQKELASTCTTEDQKKIENLNIIEKVLEKAGERLKTLGKEREEKEAEKKHEKQAFKYTVLIWTVFMMLFNQLKIEWIAKISIAGVVACGLSVLLLIIAPFILDNYGLDLSLSLMPQPQEERQKLIDEGKVSGFVEGIKLIISAAGCFFFSYGYTVVVPAMKHKMRNPNHMERAITIAVFVMTFIYAMVAIMANIGFGADKVKINGESVSYFVRISDIRGVMPELKLDAARVFASLKNATGEEDIKRKSEAENKERWCNWWEIGFALSLILNIMISYPLVISSTLSEFEVLVYGLVLRIKNAKKKNQENQKNLENQNSGELSEELEEEQQQEQQDQQREQQQDRRRRKAKGKKGKKGKKKVGDIENGNNAGQTDDNKDDLCSGDETEELVKKGDDTENDNNNEDDEDSEKAKKNCGRTLLQVLVRCVIVLLTLAVVATSKFEMKVLGKWVGMAGALLCTSALMIFPILVYHRLCYDLGQKVPAGKWVLHILAIIICIVIGVASLV